MHTLLPSLLHPIPPDLEQSLSRSPKSITAWNNITAIARNEFICWILDAQQAETRTRRIRRTVEELLEGKRRPCCWAGCIHRTDKKPNKWQQEFLINKQSKK